MTRRTLFFEAPGVTAVREDPVPTPGPAQLLVETICSAVSPGTEMLVYRGQVPQGMAVDATIDALGDAFAYPLPYGYAAVGKVIAVGEAVDEAWHGRHVFAFHPHQSHFLAAPDALHPLPEGVAPETAVFLPNMETAVSFLMDGRPVIGEQVAVFGQGIVGLLTTMLLRRTPLRRLVTLDRHPLRRDWSQRLGADAGLDPAAPDAIPQARRLLQQDSPYPGADLTFELSGNPQALDQAIGVTGYNGRLLIGSWYGEKQAPLNLGGHFHRSHMQLISTQVSHLAPRWHGRWDKTRRLQTAWQMLAAHRPARLITHRFPLTHAAAAYQLLDQSPQETLQILFTYDVQGGN